MLYYDLESESISSPSRIACKGDSANFHYELIYTSAFGWFYTREVTMRNLYILRHGPAGKRSEYEEKDDSLRPLTKKGKRVTKDVARGMLDRGIEIDIILTSPFTRARQTADIVARMYKIQDRIIETTVLEPDTPHATCVENLETETAGKDDILIVGHEPHLSGLVSYLISGFKHAGIDLKKAGLCHLTFEELRKGKCARMVTLRTRRDLTPIF